MVVQTAGAVKMANAYFSTASLTMKLFTNDITPSKTSVVGDFTQAAGGGYSSIALTAGNFTSANVGGVATTTYSPSITFAFTGALTGSVGIYGYYVVDGAGDLIFADRGAAVYTPSAATDMYIVALTIRSGTGTLS